MFRFLKYLLLIPIYFYRYFISPFTLPACRFQPTCSEYAVDALKIHGIFMGSLLIVKRLLSCHPCKKLGAKHGFDPVPPKNKKKPPRS